LGSSFFVWLAWVKVLKSLAGKKRFSFPAPLISHDFNCTPAKVFLITFSHNFFRVFSGTLFCFLVESRELSLNPTAVPHNLLAQLQKSFPHFWFFIFLLFFCFCSRPTPLTCFWQPPKLKKGPKSFARRHIDGISLSQGAIQMLPAVLANTFDLLG